MIDKGIIAKLDMKDPAVWLATWFGCGLIKGAPGTWGTLGGIPFGIAILVFAGNIPLIGAIIALYGIGLWATRKFEAMSGQQDASAIVIDEVVGIWIALLIIPMDWMGVAAAFILFRIFDVLKPWPVSHFDKMKTPNGVMMDDVMAGFYTVFTIAGLLYADLL